MARFSVKSRKAFPERISPAKKAWITRRKLSKRKKESQVGKRVDTDLIKRVVQVKGALPGTHYRWGSILSGSSVNIIPPDEYLVQRLTDKNVILAVVHRVGPDKRPEPSGKHVYQVDRASFNRLIAEGKIQVGEKYVHPFEGMF